MPIKEQRRRQPICYTRHCKAISECYANNLNIQIQQILFEVTRREDYYKIRYSIKPTSDRKQVSKQARGNAGNS